MNAQTFLKALCVLTLLAVAACQRNSKGFHPAWLLDLPTLLHQQQPASGHGHIPPATGSILSFDATTAGSTSDHDQKPHVTGSTLGFGGAVSASESSGHLLRPRSLPALHAASRAHLQYTGVDGARVATLQNVADRYGLHEEQLREIMVQDGSLLVSQQGLLVWACHGLTYGGDAGGDHLQLMNRGSNSCGSTCGDGAQDAIEASDTQVDAEATVMALHFPADAAGNEAVMQEQAAQTWDLADVELHSLHRPNAALLSVGPKADEGGCPHDAQHRAKHGCVDPASDDPSVVAHLQATGFANEMFKPDAHLHTHLQPGPQPPLEDTFRLHSQPQGSVAHTVFLDFRGCAIANSYWNTATSKQMLQTEAFNLDGDPSTFSEQEQQAIIVIWQAVAQDFVPWAVDITTEDPGQHALIRESENDTLFGMHVCVGGSSITTVGGMSGGLAFTGAWGQIGFGLQPVLVFPAQLGGGHPRAIADSISHEVGHTFGLAHFGGHGGLPYDDGNGPWGPLLGLPYGRVLSQWNTGTAVTGGSQDDMELISQLLPRRADDHGNQPAAATVLCPRLMTQATSNTYDASSQHKAEPPSTCKQLKQEILSSNGDHDIPEQPPFYRALTRGVIDSSVDQDWFSIPVGDSGTLNVQLHLPSSPGGYGVNNLLAAVSVFDSSGSELVVAQPQAGNEVMLHASSDVTAGTVYVCVKSTSIQGISIYGSLGSYLLSVTFPGGFHVQQGQTAAVPVQNLPIPVMSSAGHSCLPERCAPCKGCGACQSADAAQCTCAQELGLVPKFLATAAAHSTPAQAQVVPVCRFQDVEALSFSSTSCTTASAGAMVLLNFTVSTPPQCFGHSIVAEAPSTVMLQTCPCRQSPNRPSHRLPVVHSNPLWPVDGSYVCLSGVYSYAWQVPTTAGCYQMSIQLVDGSQLHSVLQVHEGSL